MTGDLHDLVALYAVDALTADERTAFEAHLDTCGPCTAELAELRAATDHLADAASVAPPPGLRRSVLDAIAQTEQVDAPSATVTHMSARRRAASPVLAAAAAVVVLVVGAALFLGLRDGTSPVDEVIAAPDAVTTTLDLTPDGEAGTFQVVWSPEQDRVAVIASGLPDPGPDRVYELWAIVDGTPVPAGLFETDDGAVRDAVEIDDLEAAAWGVTVEPSGGSTAPTTPIVFFAEA